MPIKLVSLGNMRAELLNVSAASDAAARPALSRAGKVLKEAVRKQTGLTDHSLGDLRRMGHPYAKRHPAITIHKNNPTQVHKQSGDMLRALRGQISPRRVNTAPSFSVWFDTGIAPHARWVAYGTRIMHERDFMGKVRNDPAVHKAVLHALVTVFGREFRTQIGIRFTTT